MEANYETERDFHIQLMLHLANQLGSHDYSDLKLVSLRLTKIPAYELDRCQRFEEFWETLERRKLIEVGNYDFLTKILHLLGMRGLVCKVEELEKKIRDFRKAKESPKDARRNRLRLDRKVQLFSAENTINELECDLDRVKEREKNLEEKKKKAEGSGDTAQVDICRYELCDLALEKDKLVERIAKIKEYVDSHKKRSQKLHLELFEYLVNVIDKQLGVSPKLFETAQSEFPSKIGEQDVQKENNFENLWNVLMSHHLIYKGNYRLLVALVEKTLGEQNELIGEINSYEDAILEPLSTDVVSRDFSETKYAEVDNTQEDVYRSFTKTVLIGEGGFGAVYRYEKKEEVAVKEINYTEYDKREFKDLMKEVKIMQELSRYNHPNIVRILWAYSDKVHGKLYIGMEYMEAGSLSKKIGGRALREDEIKSYTQQILRGVKFIHDKRIVHRDIKPDNILFDRNNCIKLGDFGIAKQLNECTVLYDEGSRSEQLSDIGLSHGATTAAMGTCQYMSPEVVHQGYDDASVRRGYGLKTDIWSVGCVVLEMASGKRPWSGERNHIQVLFRIGNDNAPPVADNVADDEKEFIAKTFIVNPQDRPSAKELLQDKFLACVTAGVTDDTRRAVRLTSADSGKEGIFSAVGKSGLSSVDSGYASIPSADSGKSVVGHSSFSSSTRHSRASSSSREHSRIEKVPEDIHEEQYPIEGLYKEHPSASDENIRNIEELVATTFISKQGNVPEPICWEPEPSVLTKVEMEAIRRTLEETLKRDGPKGLCGKSMVRNNMAMGVIGNEGGNLSFLDKFVTMDIPPGALDEPKVIHCFWPITEADIKRVKGDLAHYTPTINCGPDGTTFKKDITLRIMHCITEKDRNNVEKLSVFSRNETDQTWEQKGGSLDIDGEWAVLKISHFSDFTVAARTDEDGSGAPDMKTTSSGFAIPPGDVTKREFEALLQMIEKQLRRDGPNELLGKLLIKGNNYSMSVVGPKGGHLAFSDGSVTMDIPPGALKKPKLIRCFKPTTATGKEKRKEGNAMRDYYITCGPDGTLFDKHITLRLKHYIPETSDQVFSGLDIFTRNNSQPKWKKDAAGSLEIKGEWATLKSNHFSDFMVGAISTQPNLPRRDILVSTTISTHNDQETELDVNVVFASTHIPQMNRWLFLMRSVLSSDAYDVLELESHRWYTLREIEDQDLNVEIMEREYTMRDGHSLRKIKAHELHIMTNVPSYRQFRMKRINRNHNNMICEIDITQNSDRIPPAPLPADRDHHVHQQQVQE